MEECSQGCLTVRSGISAPMPAMGSDLQQTNTAQIAGSKSEVRDLQRQHRGYKRKPPAGLFSLPVRLPVLHSVSCLWQSQKGTVATHPYTLLCNTHSAITILQLITLFTTEIIVLIALLQSPCILSNRRLSWLPRPLDFWLRPPSPLQSPHPRPTLPPLR